jgi:hypothetical protein
MVVCTIPVKGLSIVALLLINGPLTRIAPQLRNPNAQSFTHAELQRAMLETIASLNQFGEEAGVNEVCGKTFQWFSF